MCATPNDPPDPENNGLITSHRPKLFAALQSFQYKDFQWLWLGTFATFMAVSMQQITRGWLVLRLTGDSPFALSLVMMSFALPLTIMSMLGGVIADRLPKRKIMLFTAVCNVLLVLLLATLDYTGHIQFWHLIVIGIFNGTLAAIGMPSRQSLISEIVPQHDLMNAVSLNSSGMNLTRVAGPALAGVLIVFLGTAGVFYLIAFISAFAVLFTFLMKSGKIAARNKGMGVTTDIVDGFKYAKKTEPLFTLVIMSFVPALFGFPYIALLPAWAREALNAQSDGLGALMMVMGVGSLAGTVVLGSFKRLQKRGIFLMAIGLVWGIVLIIFSHCDTYVTAMPVLFLMGFFSSMFMALNMTLMQSYASPEMRGRVISMAMMTFGIMPLSAVPFGAIAESIGTPGSIQIAGLALSLFIIVFFVVATKFRKVK